MKKLFFLIFLLGTLVACNNKKTAKFPDGVGTDLLNIQEYEEKMEELRTRQAKANALYISNAYNSNNEKSKIQIVDYETTSTLLPKDIVLTGIPNSTYRLKYKISEKNLIIYKNGKPDHFTIEEQVLADKENDGTLSLEIVHYEITGFYQVVQGKDDSGNKTSKLREDRVNSKSQATHFKISRVPKLVSLPEFKNILFKADYFKGSWYTSAVIAKTSEDDIQALGYQVSIDAKWATADKIEFVKTENQILGMNANYDKRITINSDDDKLNNLTQVISFPAEYKDFSEAKKSNQNSTVEFEKIANSKNWKDREWVLLDLIKTKAPITKAINDTPVLSQFKMTDNFFMFSLQFNGSKITFAFLKEEAVANRSKITYQPRPYLTEDFRYYGFFATEKKNLTTFEKYKKESLELNRFLNRFHPEDYVTTNGQQRKRIRFLMTEDSSTDPELIKVVMNALASWDLAFKQVGLTDVDIYLDTSERVSLGDIRYNSINMVRTLTSSALFGYGPSIANPETGEIISATTNVHVTTIRDYIILTLRNYIRHKNKELEKNYPLGNKNIKAATAFALENPAASASHGSSAKSLRYGKTQCDFSATSSNLIRDIEKNPSCKDLTLIAENKNPTVDCKDKDRNCQEKENEIFLKCAEALLPLKIQATLVHELGHNLGLRHNFAASSDARFYARESLKKSIYYCPAPEQTEGKIIAKSSSVMEYTDFNEDRLTTVGPYDIEAIRYGYANKVMTNECRTLDLPREHTIDLVLKENNQKRIPIKFCTDEHVEVSFDPLCQRHDSGSTPLEVVRSTINQYNVLFATQNFRYDKAFSPKPFELADRVKNTLFKKLSMIYENWRMSLSAFIGEENSDLGKYDEASYAQLLEKMKNDPTYGPYYNSYYEASREIFHFFMTITFLPDRFCLIEKHSGGYELIELNILIKEAESNYQTKELSCTGNKIGQILGKKGKLLREVGFYFEHQKASTDAHSHLIDILRSEGGRSFYDNIANKKDELDSYWDIIGTRLDKDNAKDALVKGTSFSYFTLQKGLRFSILDEPDLRTVIINKISSRIINGISYEDIFPETKTISSESTTSKGYFPKWSSEKEYIFHTWNGLTTFIMRAGKDILNKERTKLWYSVKTNDKDIYSTLSDEQKIELKNGYFIVAPDQENTISRAFIKKLKQLIELQQSKSPQYIENSLEYDAQISLLSGILNVNIFDIKGTPNQVQSAPNIENTNHIDN